MKFRILSIVFLSVFTLSLSSFGVNRFSLFTQKQSDAIFKDLTGALNYSNASGAESLGKFFGVQVGVVGALGTAKEIEKQAQTYDPSFEIPFLPNLYAFAMVTGPFGIGVEVGYFPEVTLSDFTFGSFTIGGRWTVTDVVELSRLRVALKANYSKTDLSYSSEDSTTKESMDIGLKIQEYGGILGIDLVFVEPYVGISYILAEGDFSAEGTSLSPPVVSVTADHNSKLKGFKPSLGLEFKIPGLRIGAECSHFSGANRITAKLAIKI